MWGHCRNSGPVDSNKATAPDFFRQDQREKVKPRPSLLRGSIRIREALSCFLVTSRQQRWTDWCYGNASATLLVRQVTALAAHSYKDASLMFHNLGRLDRQLSKR